jgi:hypothetical protein
MTLQAASTLRVRAAGLLPRRRAAVAGVAILAQEDVMRDHGWSVGRLALAAARPLRQPFKGSPGELVLAQREDVALHAARGGAETFSVQMWIAWRDPQARQAPTRRRVAIGARPA